jgi:hypothetical protein
MIKINLPCDFHHLAKGPFWRNLIYTKKHIMISVISTTNSYILQPSLVEMHRKSLEYLSAIVLWKRELAFFQKLLDKYAPKFSDPSDKKKIDHFQSLITYYDGELVDEFQKKIRTHEGDLARMLQEKNESDTKYFSEHKDIMAQVESFSKTYDQFHHELYDFIEKAL